MNLFRQTKIVATLGPASANREMIHALAEAGVNVFRLNFSHGDHATHENAVHIIRALEKGSGRSLGIMADLQGPKLRLGKFKNGGIDLAPQHKIRFDLDDALGDETRVQLPHPEILSVLEEGAFVFIDDGKVRARITGRSKDHVDAVIESGSRLSDRKGLNVPGAIIPLPALTDKDKKDLKAALSFDVDWIAQSFVQRAADVVEAKELIAKLGGRAALMAKIEKPSALVDLEAIIKISDGIMLARGDLGVEIPPEDVPAAQKRVVRMVRESGKPVIVATQMLESMTENARPTRAEASDVATAVYDGTDGVMLSAETASGKYPVEAVQFMDRIARATEGDGTYLQIMEGNHPRALNAADDAITTAAYYVSHDIEAAAIVTYTVSGSTALRMARQRPHIPVLCLTRDENVARRLTMSYGVRPAYTPELKGDFSGPVPFANQALQDQGIAKKGDCFVMTEGVPFGTPGSTNMLRISEVE